MAETVNPKNPLELLEFMKNIKYDNFTDENKYIVKSRSRLLKTKKSVCYDQVELERFYFEKWKYNFKTFFAYVNLPVTVSPTHTFLIYKEKNKYYWFENSWGVYRGIHGPFTSYKKGISFVSKQLKKSSKWKEVKLFEYNKPKIRNLNLNEFAENLIKNKIKK